MPFIGNTPDVNFTSFAKQDLTGVTGSPAKRGYTLSHAVANANEIEVFVNNVRQEPTDAYTVNGTGLTMTGDVETSDDFYIIYLGKAIQTTVPPDGSVSTAKLASSAVDLTSKVTGVLPVANGGTGVSSASIGIVSGYHRATPASTTVSGGNIVGSFTQQGNSVGVTFSGNNKWTLGSAGVWSIDAKIYLYGAINPALAGFSITKNGSEFCNSVVDTAGYAGSNGDFCFAINCTAEFSTNDYIQIKNIGTFTLVSGDNNQNSHITLVKLGVLA